MQKRHLNQHGFTLIGTLAGAIMILVSLMGLLVMSIYAHKKMNELYFHRSAILAASNYFQVFYSQLQNGKMSPTQLSGQAFNVDIGRFFKGIGETDSTSDPGAMEENDQYTVIRGKIIAKASTAYEYIANIDGAQKYYDLLVGCDWYIDGVDENDSDSPSLSNPEATFYLKGPVY